MEVTCSRAHIVQTLKLGKDSQTVHGEWVSEYISTHSQKWGWPFLRVVSRLNDLGSEVYRPSGSRSVYFPPHLPVEMKSGRRSEKIPEQRESGRFRAQRKDIGRWKVRIYKCLLIHFLKNQISATEKNCCALINAS